VIGDKDVTPALEMGLRFMRDGETSLIFGNAKYAYGLSGRRSTHNMLPPHANVIYRVRIKRLVPHNSQIFLSFDFQLEIAGSKKKIGNDCYNFENLEGMGKEKALMLYKKASDIIASLIETCDKEEEKLRASKMLIDCMNNMTAVYMKAKEYGKAKEIASRVILLDPHNMTALLRAGKCSLYDPNGSFEECLAVIVAATTIDSENKDLHKLQNEYKKKKKEYSQKSKDLMLKMSAAIVLEQNQKVENNEKSEDKTFEFSQSRSSVVFEEINDTKELVKCNQHELLIGKYVIVMIHLLILGVAFVIYRMY
jgi:tetratricopeptide (TPR) repeat protein